MVCIQRRILWPVSVESLEVVENIQSHQVSVLMHCASFVELCVVQSHVEINDEQIVHNEDSVKIGATATKIHS